ncbi:MAG: signal peptide peptidase SppA [Deltaproteobacteria bacterium]|nr:signal peptide peptidase SppA [Deltaproteobacteria bacterium]
MNRFGIVMAAIAALFVEQAVLVGCPGAGRRTTGPAKAGKGHGPGVAMFVLRGRLVERRAMEDMLGPAQPVLYRVVTRLDRARRDSKIGTVVLRLEGVTAGWAQWAELRQAIERLRKAHKKVVVHFDSAGNGLYYAAAAADSVVMSPGGTLWTIGLHMELTFFKGLLDKLGIDADLLQVGKYKGASEPFTRTGMSPEFRKSLGGLVTSLYREFLSGVGAGRKHPAKWVQTRVDEGPLLADQARKQGLVDQVADFGALIQSMKGSIVWHYGKKKPAGKSLGDLLALLQGSQGSDAPSAPHVALVYALGTVVLGRGNGGLFGMGQVVASTPMVKVLTDLAKDDKVKAVVLRIDSPGGSALASELIWQAARRLGQHKPLIVSMGNVAASGGYYIASAARRILAEPGTITGSIGVVGGKLVLARLFGKIGITTEELNHGKYAGLFSSSKTFSSEERVIVGRMMKQTYQLFLKRVSMGRKVPLSLLGGAAQGRIWSGRAAKGVSLVDQVGGLYDALVVARRLGHLGADAEVAVYPRPKNWIQLLGEKFGRKDVAAPSLPGVSGWVSLVDALAPDVGRGLRLFATAAWGLRREKVMVLLPFGIRIR